jgi:hypothetical protein
METTFKEATLDGKRIAYSSTTQFLVQVGRNRGSYATRYSFTGDLHKAVAYYCAINIGNGYKKRLFSPDMNKPVLAKAYS